MPNDTTKNETSQIQNVKNSMVQRSTYFSTNKQYDAKIKRLNF